jgi:outer membrane protein OmpA-like peptidoglycan-associated protein
MRRALVPVLACGLLVVIGLNGCGWLCDYCDKRKAKRAETASGSRILQEEYIPPEIPRIRWGYDSDPDPAIDGTPDTLLTSFAFERGSAEFEQEAIGALQEAYAELQKRDPTAQLAIIGFADGFAEKADALALGRRRAEGVQRYLARLGLRDEQMQISSYGATQSTALDHERIKQARERKVEVWILR